jgi:predicted NAD/FAD-binding protein
MNNLQRLRSERQLLVTLNRGDEIDPEKVLRRFSYEHPVYTAEGVAAQARHAEISGTDRNTHFCGAYWGWGFHEDGVLSAIRACEGIAAAPALPEALAA